MSFAGLARRQGGVVGRAGGSECLREERNETNVKGMRDDG